MHFDCHGIFISSKEFKINQKRNCGNTPFYFYRVDSILDYKITNVYIGYYICFQFWGWPFIVFLYIWLYTNYILTIVLTVLILDNICNLHVFVSLTFYMLCIILSLLTFIHFCSQASALTVGCLETYRDAVCKTCDAVDHNIKSMYQLMAKCEELSKSMGPIYKLAEQMWVNIFQLSVNIFLLL